MSAHSAVLRAAVCGAFCSLLCPVFGSAAYFDSSSGAGRLEFRGGAAVISGDTGDWSGYDHLVIDFANNAYSSTDCTLWLSVSGADGTPGARVPCHYPASFSTNRRWIALSSWPAEVLKNVSHVRITRNVGMSPGNFFLGRALLLKKGERPEPDSFSWREDVLRTLEATNMAFRARSQNLREASLAAFRSACAAAGQKPGRCIGFAPGSVQVRPRAAFSAAPAKTFKARLARGECESFQVIVLPSQDERSVRVEAGDLSGPNGVFRASCISVSVMGYVETKGFPPNRIVAGDGSTVFPEPGWYPDPVLDFMSSCPVRKDDVQSFWVRVSCPREQPAGVYRGRVRVWFGDEAISFPLVVRVNDFTLPAHAPCRLAVNFQPGYSVPAGADPEYAKMCQWKRWNPSRWAPDGPIALAAARRDDWVSFLAGYGITYDRLYHSETNIPWAALERLKAEGRLGLFNLGVWGENPRYKASFLKVIKTNYDEACRRGLSAYAYIYGFDETPKSRFAAISNAIAEIKREFPSVPFLTTAFDPSLGVDEPALAPVNWFTPSIRTNCFEESRVRSSRAAGHKVWWYTCCFPHAPYPQLLLDAPPIETRLLMGAMAAKMRPDGFLYWQTAIWNSDRPICDGPFTAWNPDSYYCYHGDGSFTRVGPGGMPLATQRLENFRDGLEDLWYARLLRRSGADADVPDELVRNTADFSRSPEKLERWRNAMADAIERLHKHSAQQP